MSFIENTISPIHYPKGEQLLDDDAVLEVLQLEKQLWSVMVRDQGILEVEIMHPNTKKQKSTCDCATFSTENSCPHIVAALLYLRKKNDDQKSAAKLKKKGQGQNSFNIKTVLDNVDDVQLKNFIRSYAKKDKTFSVMLKASFAQAVKVEDTTAKYRSILNTLIKPVATKALTSTTADLRLALRVVEEYYEQLVDSMSISNFDQAISIISATISKLHYLYAKYNHNQNTVVKWIKKYHEQIALLYQESLAPNLMQRIDETLIELSQKSYYNHLDEVPSIYQMALSYDRTKVKAILEDLFSNISLDKAREHDKAVLGAMFILMQRYEKLNLNDESLVQSIEYLAKTDSNQDAIDYMEQFVHQDLRNRKIERALLSAYEAQGMTDKYHQMTILLYAKYNDIRYYRMLKSSTGPSSWPQVRESLIAALLDHKASASHLASFYAHEDMKEELIDTLASHVDLRLIMKHDHSLYKTHYSTLLDLYKSALKSYLESHGGITATSFVTEVFSHISRINAFKLERALKEYINTEFSHRGGYHTFS